MEYVVIRSGGKQYKVKEGDTIEVDKIISEKDKEIVIDDVLLWVSGEKVKIGKPKLPNVKVKAKVLEQKKGEKIKVGKFKSKVRYRRVVGFRPLLTKVKIEEIKTKKD
ncbi:MAG: 50S ribosomal protein L21 [Patescibacteria group bacterium]|nr:50S ribosomal protein L21 [Patescibacteria group bacterium]